MTKGEKELRIGRIDFANVTPLFLALEKEGVSGVRYVRGIPTELNRKLRCGEVDLSPSSSIEYLRHPDLYGFLPDLSISSIGPVESVCLFSRLPAEALSGRAVALSPASATSVVLLRVLFERYLGVKPTYVEDEANADAVLRIGDQALQEVKAGAWPRMYDLGALWFEHTRTPFVFALWICRRDAFESRRSEVKAFYRTLVRARHLAYRSYPEYARESPESEWMGASALLSYWQTISYDLTAWHREGLRLFAQNAWELGALEATPPLAALPVEG